MVEEVEKTYSLEEFEKIKIPERKNLCGMSDGEKRKALESLLNHAQNVNKVLVK